MNKSAIHFTFEERREKVITQLKHYFGDNALDFVSYSDKIWNNKYIQPKDDYFLPPHFNNGHPLFEESYINNKLFFTGTETSKLFGGFMEGAIISSNSVATRISSIIKK